MEWTCSPRPPTAVVWARRTAFPRLWPPTRSRDWCCWSWVSWMYLPVVMCVRHSGDTVLCLCLRICLSVCVRMSVSVVRCWQRWVSPRGLVQVRHRRAAEVKPCCRQTGTVPHTYIPTTHVIVVDSRTVLTTVSLSCSVTLGTDWQLADVCVCVCACLHYSGAFFPTSVQCCGSCLCTWMVSFTMQSTWQSLCEVLAYKPHGGRSQCWWTNVCIDYLILVEMFSHCWTCHTEQLWTLSRLLCWSSVEMSKHFIICSFYIVNRFYTWLAT